MKWTVLGIFVLTTFILIRPTSSLSKKSRQACSMDHIRRGRHGCVTIIGGVHINKAYKCNQKQMKTVKRIDGYLSFDEGEYKDPMACFPSLETIIIPEGEPEYENRSAINVNFLVTKMELFKVNSSLVIFSNNKVPWITIDAYGYVMNAETFLFLSSRFGTKKLSISNYAIAGYCDYELQGNLQYLSDLDHCVVLIGSLKIGPNLVTSETTTRLKKITGDIIIQGTNLDLNHLYFLRFVEVHGYNLEITNNYNLGFTQGFVQSLVKNHVNIINPEVVEKTIIKTLTSNGHPNFRVGRCSAEDIFNETEVCTSVWGDLMLRANLLPKLKELKEIHGRLIIMGYAHDNPFNDLPRLELIDSIAKGPALVLTENMFLTKLVLPKNLTIHGKNQALISVRKNKHFKLTQEEYMNWERIYGAHRIDADVLLNGECFFPNPIEDLSQLDNCSFISGDLVINEQTEGTTMSQILLITGCIHVSNSNLTDLNFLQNIDEMSSMMCKTGHVLRHNLNLCAAPWIEKLGFTRRMTGFYRMQANDNKNDCSYFCSRDDVWIGTECLSVSEGLPVPINDDSDQFLRYSVAVENVFGQVSIRHSDLTDVNTFTSLKHIEIEGDEPAIDIEHNEHLREVKFHRLESINSTNTTSVLIRIRNNGNYSMPAGQYKKLVDKYGEERLDIDHQVDHSLYYGIGIGIGVIALVVIAGVIIVLVINIRSTNKQLKQGKSRKEKETSRTKEKNGFDEGDRLRPTFGKELHAEEENKNVDTNTTRTNLDIKMQDTEELKENPEMCRKNGQELLADGHEGKNYNNAPGLQLNNLKTNSAAPMKTSNTDTNNIEFVEGTASKQPKSKLSTKKDLLKQSDVSNVAQHSVHGPRTAASAMVAGKQWYGDIKNNISTMDTNANNNTSTAGPKAAETAGKCAKWDSGANAKVSIFGPKTAMTAGKWEGGMKANASVMDPKVTINTGSALDSKNNVSSLPDTNKKHSSKK